MVGLLKAVGAGDVHINKGKYSLFFWHTYEMFGDVKMIWHQGFWKISLWLVLWSFQWLLAWSFSSLLVIYVFFMCSFRLYSFFIKVVGMALTVKDILEARTVTQTPAMAPACGLYLADVKYEFGDMEWWRQVGSLQYSDLSLALSLVKIILWEKINKTV